MFLIKQKTKHRSKAKIKTLLLLATNFITSF